MLLLKGLGVSTFAGGGVVASCAQVQGPDLSHTLTLSLSRHSLTLSLSHSPTTLALSHTLSLSLSHPLTLSGGRARG